MTREEQEALTKWARDALDTLREGLLVREVSSDAAFIQAVARGERLVSFEEACLIADVLVQVADDCNESWRSMLDMLERWPQLNKNVARQVHRDGEPGATRTESGK
jgi:hypothetical protein